MRYAGQIENIYPPGADGWIKVDMRFEIELQARAFALGFGGRLEVVAPSELRERVLTLAQAIVSRMSDRK